MKMLNFGVTEIMLILLIILILFGPKRIPEVAKSVGNAVNEFKSALKWNKGKKLQR